MWVGFVRVFSPNLPISRFQLEIEKKDALITKQREQIVEAAKTLEAVTEQLTTK